jgi:hypothetical protein
VERFVYATTHWSTDILTHVSTPNIGTYSYKATKTGPFTAKWLQASSAEFRRLVTETNVMQFVSHSTKPSHRLASYYNPQPRIKFKDGDYEFRIQGTYGGNLSDYTGEVSALTASIATVKTLLQSTISTPNAKFISLDIKDFYPQHKLDTMEYMRIRRDQIPDDIIDEYNLHSLFVNDFVMVEITGAIYGLPQSGLISQQALKLQIWLPRILSHPMPIYSRHPPHSVHAGRR